jgi:menaquinone-9 beta-reductase
MFAHASYDVLVVGARCAGAATAMLLARRGLRVLAIDRAQYGTDTISTHALMRGGVLQLHRWGVLPLLRRQGLPAIRETTFHYDDEAVPIAIRSAHGVEALYAPRRMLLDSVLADVAEQAGATVWYGHSLAGLLHRPDGRVCGATVLDASGEVRTIKADLVVGADGIGSSVARLSGARVKREAHNTTAVVYGHFPGLDLTGSHWWFRAGISAGAIPTNYGRHCVFVAMPPAQLRSGLWRDDRMAAFRDALAEVERDLAASVNARGGGA